MPEAPVDMSEYPWFVSAKRVLELIFPGDKTPYSIVDLGCLEGGYAVEFARMGFKCLGVEVRDINFAACQYVKERVNLPNLSFAQDDVWNVANYGCFDAAFCCGIIYHLERPRAFLELLSKITKRVMILQTLFAYERESNEFGLSSLTEWEGAVGRWYTEPEPPPEPRDQDRWSGWKNRKSFWLTRPWILQSLNEVGFDLVLEQFDCLAPSIVTEMTEGYYYKQGRGTFVGVRTNNQ